MAAEDSSFRPRDDASFIALLRSLRSGAADLSFVHRADVCSAAPADLVANLEPVPGTDLDQGGYNAIWLFYCPKRFKNAQGKPSGHRQRAIAGGDACWHSETRPKPVKGLEGATLCNLSYGRKEEGSRRSFNRMGWCMTEYDDDEGGGGDGHVLCKVYRSSSSLARRKLKSSSSSTTPTSSVQTVQSSSSTCNKRKATADHPQAPANKISHAQACASNYACVDQEFYHVDHQVQEPLLNDDQMTMPVGIDYVSPFPAEEEQEQLQQNTLVVTAEDEQFQQHTLMMTAEEEQLQQNYLMTVEELLLQDNTMFTFQELLGGCCSPNTEFTMDEMLSRCCGPPTAVAPMDAAFFDGLAF